MLNISPTSESVQKAFRLGRDLALTDPNFLPQLDDAAEYPNYVLFMLAHRKKLEALPSFWTWDLRLEDLIEEELENHGISLKPDNVEEVLRKIAMPLRCAFWFGWESFLKLERKYEQATGIRSTSMTTAVHAADLQAAKGDLGMLEPKPAQQEPELDLSSPVNDPVSAQ